MFLLQLLLLLVVAGICGAIGQAIVGYSHGGCLASIALGFIGALLGSWLAKLLGLPPILAVSVGGQPFPVVWSIAGSALFVAVLSFLTRGGGRRMGRRKPHCRIIDAGAVGRSLRAVLSAGFLPVASRRAGNYHKN